MEEQFIRRVPPSVSERIERLFNENDDAPLNLTFAEDGRTGTFLIGNERFTAALLDFPCVVEPYKIYDDNMLTKTADIGQMVMVREEGDPSPEGIEYRHGLTPPTRDARRRRFRREPDLNPELVQRVEKDILNIMSGGTVKSVSHIETAEPGAIGRKAAPTPAAKPEVVPVEAPAAGGEPERSDSDYSMEHEN